MNEQGLQSINDVQWGAQPTAIAEIDGAIWSGITHTCGSQTVIYPVANGDDDCDVIEFCLTCKEKMYES